MKKIEKNTTESVNVVANAANVITIDDATAKLNLQVGAVFEYEGKRLEITAKRSNTEENPTTGGKTLWSGNIDGENFTEIDVTKLRKIFGLAERKREKSAGKTFEFEGNTYSLDETADAMINNAIARYKSLLSQLQAFEAQYSIPATTPEAEEAFVAVYIKHITAKIEAVCLARKIAAEEAEKAKAAEKEAKAKASKEHREKVKEAKAEFFALLSAGIPFAEVTAKIAEKYGLQVSDLA